ncbi:kinase-like protein [Obba rivulosa]|uniref:non-specific serine/threonine protein kinase n=1 Tax=Obba rivulosa TaxID=1052685 RepID=A0A8E2J781_9APHY|nr:kinase-like protein [Obba rivulosa]
MSSHSSAASSAGSVSGFPEEDLRSGGRHNPGYFPARLGQTLQEGRYCIVRKLGWGQYSNVWLARDRGEESFVALKILTCEATGTMSPGPNQRSDEQRMLEKIGSAQPTHPGFQHTLKYHDSFQFKGPHGMHCCLVTEALGYSLDYLRKSRDEGDRRVPPSIVKKVVKQVLLGLDYLHQECGIVHSDLKHDNILFRPRDLQSVVAHELVSSPSVTYDCGTEVSLPIVPVVSQCLPLSPNPSIHERLLDAVIADVGHSHWQDHHFQELIQPSALRAPEVILGYPWSTQVDIWNLGCLVTELLIGFWLFEPNIEKLWGYEEDHLARMTEALEASFEPSFLDRCAHRDKYFKADGSFAHFTAHEEPTWPLRKLLETFSELGEEEVQSAERFVRRCLRLTPEERATTKELIDDPWLADSA